MRRYANVWAVGHAATKAISFRVPRVFEVSEGNSDLTDMGEGRFAPGEVFDHGTYEEDGPGTWETLVSPRRETGDSESR